MKRYIPLNEEMLDGVLRPIQDSTHPQQVFRIESKNDLKILGPEPRGIIAIGNLYMTKTNDKLMHLDIAAFLRRNEGLNLPSNLNPKILHKSLADCLYVQMFRGNMLLAESYVGPVVNTLIKVSDNKKLTPAEKWIYDNIEKHLEVLRKLHIPYKLQAI